MYKIVSISSCFPHTVARNGAIDTRFLIDHKTEFCVTFSAEMTDKEANDFFGSENCDAVIDDTVIDYNDGAGACTAVEFFGLMDPDGQIIAVSSAAGIDVISVMKSVLQNK